MKNRFNIFAALTIAAIAFAFALAVRAQPAGVSYIGTLSGTPVRVLALTTNVVAIGLTSTNTYGLPGTTNQPQLIQSVSEFDNVPITWSYLSGSNATVDVYKSYDGMLSYDAKPSFSISGPATTSGAFSTNALLDCKGVSHLAFVIKNASTLDMTNAQLTVNLKSPKWQSKPATY
jgi:hypothetical protein